MNAQHGVEELDAHDGTCSQEKVTNNVGDHTSATLADVGDDELVV